MTETRTCQNCKSDFVIEPEDFDFYKKIGVPPPTWCSECRMIRRFAWRNERSLYKRVCDLCGKDIIAMYNQGNPFPAYCHDCWYSDKWDPLNYGVSYEFSKPFFAQWKELFNRVPRLNLWQMDMVDSPYSNIGRGVRNAYLSYSLVGGGGENIFYSKSVDLSSNIFDCLSVSNCESCYENVLNNGNNNSHYCVDSLRSIDCWFLFDCWNCQNCILSTNLRNGKYVIRNKQYSKEGYFEEIKKFNFGSYARREEVKKEFGELILGAIRRYATMGKVINTTGNYNGDAKNAVNCFYAYNNVENIKHCQRVINLKDSYDVSYHINSELVYEYIIGGKDSRGIRFTMAGLDALRDSDYTDHCGSSSNLFGCIGVRNKRFCILNKQYDEKEYESLRTKIIEQMGDLPYFDSGGRSYSYGEFFPIDLSPFGYNETIAQEHFPLNEKTAEIKGYRWREKEKPKYNATIGFGDLPDDIDDVYDSILKETIVCEHHEKNKHDAYCEANCTTAFKITPFELRFYRSKGIPIPRICPNCRHFERLQKVNPLKLWRRQCMCDYEAHGNTVRHSHHPEGRCPNEFETSYSPERKEIVYCEQCYQTEVI